GAAQRRVAGGEPAGRGSLPPRAARRGELPAHGNESALSDKSAHLPAPRAECDQENYSESRCENPAARDKAWFVRGQMTFEPFRTNAPWRQADGDFDTPP